MTYAVDTDFLFAAEIRDHTFHRPADDLLSRLLESGHNLAVAPQNLAQFIHVVTDPRRLAKPLALEEAVERAEQWWQAKEVVRMFPDASSTLAWLDLLRRHRIGRKRLLDTMLAATCRSNGVGKLISNNNDDFQVFEFLEIVNYRP